MIHLRYFEYDIGKKERTFARITYDAIFQRERIIEEYVLGTADNYYDILYLHSEKIMYVYDLKQKTCTKQTVDRPWRDFGIPNNATSLGESYVGSSAVPKANVLTTIWSDKFVNEKGDTINYRGVWTYSACLPINIVYTSDSLGLDRHISFFDIVPGISDPNVFTPRKECLTAH